MKRYPTIEELNDLIGARWLDILELHASSDLAEALRKPGKHVTCPFHGGKGDFRIDKKKGPTDGLSYCTCGVRNGWTLLCEVNNWSIIEAKDAVSDYLGLSSISEEERKEMFRKAEADRLQRALRVKAENRKEAEETSRKRNKVWQQTLPLTHRKSELGRAYLLSRKLDPSLLTSHVRFHPKLAFYQEESGKLIGYYPALVSRVYDNAGKPITLHRTYLDPQTGLKVKYKDENAKKLMEVPELWKDSPGRVIPLTKGSNPEVLGIAEGIETALAASMATGISVWSTVSSRPLRKFVPPASVKTLVIFADLDRSEEGQNAADDLIANLSGTGWSGKVLVMLPQPFLLKADMKGVDWADVWLNFGRTPFKSKLATRSLQIAS